MSDPATIDTIMALETHDELRAFRADVVTATDGWSLNAIPRE